MPWPSPCPVPTHPTYPQGQPSRARQWVHGVRRWWGLGWGQYIQQALLTLVSDRQKSGFGCRERNHPFTSPEADT